MRCEEARRMISARLDSCLDPSERLRLEHHLASCTACRVEWERMEALDQLFRSAAMEEAPSRLHIRVTSRIQRREQARRAVIGGFTLMAGAATLALLLVLPLALGLLGNLGIGPALIRGGLETFTQLLALFDALSRTFFVLLDQFALPLAILSAGCLLIAAVLNGIWIVLVRKLYGAR